LQTFIINTSKSPIMNAYLSSFVNDRNNNFNLIRFIAALMVLYSHNYGLIGRIDPLKGITGLTCGEIAVDVFFVTSGFLISSSFFRRKTLLRFVWARVLRIYPALIMSSLFCTFFIGLSFTQHTIGNYLTHPSTFIYFFKNISLIFGVEYYLPGVFTELPKSAVNGSVWTLPHELRMYSALAFLGIVITWLQKKQTKKLIQKFFLTITFTTLFIKLLTPYCSILPINPNHIRLFSMFFMGVTFFLFQEEIILSKKLFVTCLVILFLSSISTETFLPFYSLCLPYLIFYIAYIPQGHLLEFNKFGDFSYGIYLYSFPIQQSILASIPTISFIQMLTLSTLASLTVAFFSWHLIEKKALLRK